MAATVAQRVWEVPSRRITARSASVLIPIPERRNHQRVVSQHTKAMATATTTITTLVVITMAATVAQRAWEVLSRRITARSASVLIPIPKRRNHQRVVSQHTKAMATATTTTTTLVVITM